MLALIVLFGLFGGIYSAAIGDQCPDVKAMPNFDLSKYIGTWYEASRYHNIFESDGICAEEILHAVDEKTVQVLHTMKKPKTYQVVSYNATLIPADDQNNGHMKIQYAGRPASDYIVLQTDYDNFAVVWSCTVYEGKRLDLAWVLTRAKTPSLENSKLLDEFIRNETPIDSNRLINIPQNCPEV